MDKPKTTAKDFFFYFWITVSLYMSVVSLVALLFAVINHAFPDVSAYLYGGDTYSTGVRIAISTLIVIFPVFILMSRYVYHAERADPQKRELGMRKWLTYINLFVAGLTLIIDLITVLNRFLSGNDFTTAFFLKALSVLVVVGAVFWYYVYDLRHPPSEAGNVARNSMWGAIVFVVLALIIGFIVMGSPVTQRMRIYDTQRVSDLTEINNEVINYWQLKQELPNGIGDLDNTATGYTVPKDPETGQDYTYEADGPLTYKLCATFDLDNTQDAAGASPTTPALGIRPDSWAHSAGDMCFTRTIDPAFYPPINK